MSKEFSTPPGGAIGYTFTINCAEGDNVTTICTIIVDANNNVTARVNSTEYFARLGKALGAINTAQGPDDDTEG